MLRQFEHAFIMSLHHVFDFYGHQMELIVDSGELLVGIDFPPIVIFLLFVPWRLLGIVTWC